MKQISLAVFVLAICFGPEVCAQTISPPVQEIVLSKSSRARGEILVTNSSVLPLIVVLQPHSFLVGKDGKTQISDISPDLHLRLSETSVKIAAKSDRTFTWDVSQCSPNGAAFQIYAITSAAGKIAEGVQVKIVFGATIYLESRSVPKADYSAILSADGKTLTLQNSGDFLARPHVFVTVNKHREELGPYPSFPRSERVIKLPEVAEAAEARFAHFKIEATRGTATQTAQK